MSTACSGALIGQHDDPELSSDRVRLRRSIALALLTLVIPGSAQLVHGSRRVGRIAIRVWISVLALGLLLAFVVWQWPTSLFWFLTHGWIMWLGRWLLVALAIGWGYLVFDAWRLGKPTRMRRGHLATATLVHGAIAVTTAGALLFTAHIVAVMNGFAGTVFAAGASTEAHDGRYNILLLGGDSGAGRTGLRPDSINVLSIDAETGQTVIIGLPRNLENIPFPEGSVMHDQFPNGFDCDGCMLNSVNTWANDHADLFDSDEPGIDATMGAVEEITGLKLNYYVLVNMEGFADLVDAVGGVELTIPEPVARFGHDEAYRMEDDPNNYIPVGTHVLSGNDVLWYSRSRVQSDDFSRMARQKCVMKAMLDQTDPQAVVANLEDIANSSAAMLQTNIPRSDLDTFMSLALQARTHPVSSVSLVPPEINTGDPDYKKIRRMVSDSIDAAEGTASAGDSGSGAGDSSGSSPAPTTPVPGSSQEDIKQANSTSDLSAVC